VRLHLTIDLGPCDEDKTVHPRIAGALRDYAEAVIQNNQTVMRWKRPDAQPQLVGEPPVGLTNNGVLYTAQGVTISEAIEQ
jgi:hypothetical protein